MTYVGEPAKVLDFDTESRPLTYLGSDYTTAEVTAIAWCYIKPSKRQNAKAVVLGEDDLPTMLETFRAVYEEADVVTGHNLIRHDLPRLNAMYLEAGYPPLPPVMVQDTYLHLRRKDGVSGSQESLAAMLGVTAPKQGMSQADWREANRLTPEGIAKSRLRCVSDVIQHVELYRELLRLRWLKPPTSWAG